MSNNDMDISADTDLSSIQTTVGELVEVITAIAQKAGRTEEECYKLASFTVEKLLRDKRRKELLS
jgi:hypothetical protein